MRAIILSAGQGRRLLPLTRETPKCLLPVRGQTSLLEHQLETLASCGLGGASVLIGFGADQIEEHLGSGRHGGLQVDTLLNPFFRSSDNLATAWMARSEMREDFVLLNGDTLFEADVLRRLLAAPPAPITMAINRKRRYDDDDMKVSLNGGQSLRAVGKRLAPVDVDGESIGLIRFLGRGATAFRQALEAAIREPEALGAWYLSVLNGLADSMPIETADISGLWWGEVDCPSDLEAVRRALRARGPLRRQARLAPQPLPG